MVLQGGAGCLPQTDLLLRPFPHPATILLPLALWSPLGNPLCSRMRCCPAVAGGPGHLMAQDGVQGSACDTLMESGLRARGRLCRGCLPLSLPRLSPGA